MGKTTQDDINKLNELSKSIRRHDYEGKRELQEQIDKAAAATDEQESAKRYLIFEAQARLHLLNENYNEANRFCKEATRLHGADYGDGVFLAKSISQDRNHAQAALQANKNASELEADKRKMQGFLALAIIGLVVFVIMFFSANDRIKQQSKMIDTCTSEISDITSTLSSANDAIGSMKDQLDSISSEADLAADSDYDTQASTLHDIFDKAYPLAKNLDDFSAPSTNCAQINSGSN
jgi:Fe2+ transport system protein B